MVMDDDEWGKDISPPGPNSSGTEAPSPEKGRPTWHRAPIQPAPDKTR